MHAYGCKEQSRKQVGTLFRFIELEGGIRVDRPLRTIRAIAKAALSDLSRAFRLMYTDIGRPSIAPEALLRAMLLRAFYGIRSERQLMERLEFDLLFRKAWLFAGSDCGAERAAVIDSLIGTAKLNDIDPQVWFVNVLARIVDTPQSRLGGLLPWNWRAAQVPGVLAA